MERLSQGLPAISFLQLQTSAYSAWRTHVDGAWALVRAHGGLSSTFQRWPASRGVLLHNFVIMDIFATTTQPIRTMAEASEVLRRYREYEAYITDTGRVDDPANFLREVVHSATPIPRQLLFFVARINQLRAHHVLCQRWGAGKLAPALEEETGLWEAWDDVDLSDLADCIIGIVCGSGEDSRDDHVIQATRQAWQALLTAYHSAAYLYATNSSSRRDRALSDVVSSGRSFRARHALRVALQLLFDQKDQRRATRLSASGPDQAVPPTSAGSCGLLHKFAIWPLVVAGVDCAFGLGYGRSQHNDGNDDDNTEQRMAQAELAGRRLRAIGEEVGSFSVLDAGLFVDGVVERMQAISFTAQMANWNWEDLFSGRPLFLL
jgi:hypothetical protein